MKYNCKGEISAFIQVAGGDNSVQRTPTDDADQIQNARERSPGTLRLRAAA
jgi:hypothetical protein